MQARIRRFLLQKIGTDQVQEILLAQPQLIDDRLEYFNHKYDFQQVIGLGAFGVVIAADEVATGEQRAIKIFNKNRVANQQIEILKNEASILKHLATNPRVVALHQVHETHQFVLLVMERIRGHSLLQFTKPLPIPRFRGPAQFFSLMPRYFDRQKTRKLGGGRLLAEQKCAQVIRGVLQGLKYIHSKQVIHRDLKPENILLSSCEDLSSATLIDFGLSDFHASTTTFTPGGQKCGTLLYMAPQQAEKQRYGKVGNIFIQGVDIWACGVIMYQMLTGTHPFYSGKESVPELLQKMKSNERQQREIGEQAKC